MLSEKRRRSQAPLTEGTAARAHLPALRLRPLPPASSLRGVLCSSLCSSQGQTSPWAGGRTSSVSLGCGRLGDVQ